MALLLILLLCTSFSLPLGAAVKTPTVVSYGVAVLAARMDVAICGMVGNEICFSADVFARGLNLSEVEYITVSSLPAVTVGELLLGSSRVAPGQTIAGENLVHLNFRAASDDVRQASFGFYANGEGVPLVCNLYLLSERNLTPTVGMAPQLSLSVSTYQDISLYGKLSAYDPDGDALCFEIVSYPQRGALRMVDAEEGSYVYTPENGYVGSDRFTYVARDLYGNYSRSATVELKVALSGTSVTYVDMLDSDAYSDAIFLTEAGIMSGSQVGSLYYFYPKETVSRVEFLVMAMNAVGITEPPACDATVFADDAAIAPTMKGYVDMAYSLGYINGSVENGALSFLPDQPIRRAEAAVILGNIVGLSEVAVTPTFADTSEIPAWARDAVYSLYSVGILNSRDGYISPTSEITREQTAEMLAAVMAYVEK